ncbi:Hr96 family protein [Megaselia abdita]
MSSKYCQVCGDKALGYNFSAITCESCKAFFRRNALTKKLFNCPFNDNCEISIVTRRFCQKCRLKKCFDIGMKKENIMSEEDKKVKRKKIELNRAKRKHSDSKSSPDDDIKRECQDSMDGHSISSMEGHLDHVIMLPQVNPKDLSATELVDHIVEIPERASQVLNLFMKTPEDVIEVLEKIITSQSDALKLVQHLIAYPGDALKIISKLMNSPFEALTVFTKFMSSPTDALEIITKIVNSPQDVVEFVKQLMKSPENALHLMNTFLNSPAEALKIINRMVSNGSLDSEETPIINSMLEEAHSNNNSPTYNNITNGHPSSSVPYPENPENDSIPMDDQVPQNEDSMSFTFGDFLNPLESVLSEVIRLEYSEAAQPVPCDVKDLNDNEFGKLRELRAASEALFYPLDDEFSHLSDDVDDKGYKQNGDPRHLPPQLLKIINITAIAIKRLIKMSKKVAAFRNLCQEDQVALLKGGCTEIMICRSAMSYDCDRKTWKIPHSKEDMSNINAEVLKLAKGNVYEELQGFMSNFDLKLRMDENIILIMCAILLFSPNRPRIVHSEVIKLEQV